MSEAQRTATIALDQPRVIAFTAKGHNYRYTFPRLSAADWEQFFNGIVVTSENRGKAQVTVVDMHTPGMKLVEEKVSSVAGYANAEAFMQLPDWRSRLLPAHTKAVFGLLTEVKLDAADDERPIDPMHIEVALQCAWTADDDGSMILVRGLVHRFNPPSAEIKQRYNRAMSETRVVGGSRNGKTVYVPRQMMLAQMYDELIAGVEGYSVAGLPITTADEARREMDTFHKVTAVKALFTEPEMEDSEASE